MLTLTCPANSILDISLPVKYSTSNVEVEIFSKALELPALVWEDLIPESEPFLRFDYLYGLEQACQKEMEFRYVLFRRGNKALALAYFQIFTFDTRKLTAYTSGKNLSMWSRIRHGLGKLVEKVAVRPDHRLLVNGNAFLSGEYGFFHDPLISREEAEGWVLKALKELETADRRIFASLLKDVPASPGKQDYFLSQGFHHFQADPEMEIVLSPEWRDFSDYLDAMSSKYRQRARSAYKKSRALVVRELSLQEIISYESILLKLYHEVLRDDKFCLKEIGEGYFPTLKREMGDACRVTAYFYEETLLAYRTTLEEGSTLQAHFIGYQQVFNHDLKLYQRILYDLVGEAVSGKFQSLGMGRTSMEIKSSLGATPREHDLFLRLKNPLLNRLARPLIHNIPREPWISRHPFKEV